MCGIFGFITTGSRSVDEIDFDVAVRALRHRGPDDSGVWRHYDDDLQVGLVATRLAVIDPSAAGHQPMTSDDGAVTLVYNGEVYNFEHLRQELEALGPRCRGRSDTEVILYGYLEFGAAVVERMRGMFAFGLWDARRRALVLARDRLGVKPLYLSKGPGWLAFSSEVRAMVRAGVVGLSIRPEGLQSYLMYGSVSEPYTILFNVEAHPPGHVSEWTKERMTTRRYWSFPQPAASCITSTEAAEQVGEVLRDSVKIRLNADVPVGLFLSGGVDSTTVLSVAYRTYPRLLKTFTLSYADRRLDESEVAVVVARHFGTEHYSVQIGSEEALQLLPEALKAQDQPSLDGVNTYIISKTARDAGLTVALSGIGGDELFVGYRRFTIFEWFLRLPQGMGTIGRQLCTPLAAAVGNLKAPWWLCKGLWLAATLHNPLLLYSGLRSVFLPDHITRLMAPGSVRLPPFVPVEFEAAVPFSSDSAWLRDPIAMFSYLEMSNYLRNTILRDTDVMSMAHGLEIREPLLDHRLVEVVLPLPPSVKLDGSLKKPLLVRAAAEQVVRGVALRPKQGFELPFAQWLRNELRPIVEANIEAAIRLSDGLIEAAAARRLLRDWFAGHPGVKWFHVHALSNFGAWRWETRASV